MWTRKPRWWEHEHGNMTVHLSYPFLRPAQFPMPDAPMWLTFLYACCLGFSIQVMFLGWRSFFLIPMILYTVLYRRWCRLEAAKQMREAMGVID